jgi:hypothetical protein
MFKGSAQFSHFSYILFLPFFLVTNFFFTPSSFLLPLSRYSPFFYYVYFVSALSYFNFILFGTGKGNIIQRGLTQNMKRMNTKGKWVKRKPVRREGSWIGEERSAEGIKED